MLRYSYRFDAADGYNLWDVVDNMYPPKVIKTFAQEADAIHVCRILNIRGKKEDGLQQR